MGAALGARRVRVDLPADLPLLQVRRRAVRARAVQPARERRQIHAAGTPIEISAATVDDRVKIFIDDHGPGLPRNREEAIFEKFERGRKESATPGVGLGLAICRAIVEAHGGRITGETRSGGGARFTIDLPRGDPPEIAETDVEPPQETAI